MCANPAVILYFLTKIMGDVIVKFKVSAHTLLLYEVIHIIRESIHVTFVMSSLQSSCFVIFVCSI